MKSAKEILKTVFRIFLSVMMTLSLTMEFAVPDYANVDITVNSELIANLVSSLPSESFKTTVVFAFILWFLIWTEQMNTHKIKWNNRKLFYVLCMAVGFVWLVAKSFEIDNSMSNLFETRGQIVKSIIYYIGSVSLLALIGKFIFFSVECSDSKFQVCKYSDVEIRRGKYGTFIFLMIMWLPHLIMAYPASMISDAWGQLRMFYGEQAFTSHHPPFHTWLIGMAVQLGRKMGSANMGLFLFILLQTILFALVLSYSITTMKRLNAPRWLIVLTKFIAVVSPYYTAYIGLITKDTLYSYAFLLFMIELIYLVYLLRGEFWHKRMHTVLLLLSGVFVILLRNNGKYVIFPMLFIIGGIMVKDGVLKEKKRTVRAAACLSMTVLIPIVVTFILTAVYNIEKGSIREMLSLPFQQTGRYVLTYSDEVTDQERQAIDKILDYDSLSDGYNPLLADYVKNTFRKESTGAELAEYFKVWLRQLTKHPLTYVVATLNQNYKLLYPVETEYAIGLVVETYDSRFDEFIKSLGIDETNLMKKKEFDLRNFYILMFHTPIAGFFSLIAVYNLVLLYILMYAAYNRMHSMWIAAAPLIISDLVVVAGPLVHPRYVLPVMYSIPIVVAVFLYVRRKDHGETDEQ